MTEYCKYCDTLTNGIVKEYQNGVLVWAGCFNCHIKKESRKNATDTKQV